MIYVLMFKKTEKLIVYDEALPSKRRGIFSAYSIHYGKIVDYDCHHFEKGSLINCKDYNRTLADKAYDSYNMWLTTDEGKRYLLDVEQWRTQRIDQAIANHASEFKKRKMSVPKVLYRSRRFKKRRQPHCYACKQDLDNAIDPECTACGWIICECGACGCNYSGPAKKQYDLDELGNILI